MTARLAFVVVALVACGTPGPGARLASLFDAPECDGEGSEPAARAECTASVCDQVLVEDYVTHDEVELERLAALCVRQPEQDFPAGTWACAARACAVLARLDPERAARLVDGLDPDGDDDAQERALAEGFVASGGAAWMLERFASTASGHRVLRALAASLMPAGGAYNTTLDDSADAFWLRFAEVLRLRLQRQLSVAPLDVFLDALEHTPSRPLTTLATLAPDGWSPSHRLVLERIDRLCERWPERKPRRQTYAQAVAREGRTLWDLRHRSRPLAAARDMWAPACSRYDAEMGQGVRWEGP